MAVQRVRAGVRSGSRAQELLSFAGVVRSQPLAATPQHTRRADSQRSNPQCVRPSGDRIARESCWRDELSTGSSLASELAVQKRSGHLSDAIVFSTWDWKVF